MPVPTNLRYAVVADAAAVLGRQTNGDLDGTYLPTMTKDDVHPNDAGHAAVADLLKPIIKALAGFEPKTAGRTSGSL